MDDLEYLFHNMIDYLIVATMAELEGDIEFANLCCFVAIDKALYIFEK